MITDQRNKDFDAMRLRLASPDVIREWSHGEVLKPETINYRTQKPERDGLFCERIFGPSKDWECYCGKYKKIRYKGIVCDKCGVEVTRVIVRRERMGHIELASPVSHIWLLRGVPSSIGLALDLSIQNLEKVIYFANFIITNVSEDEKKTTMEQLRAEYLSKRKGIEAQYTEGNEPLEKRGAMKEARLLELEELFTTAERELKTLRPLKILSESEYRDLSLKYGHIFEAQIGAKAIRLLLERINSEKEAEILKSEIGNNPGLRGEKMIRRLRFFTNLIHNGIRPEWMILTNVPVIPPDLRPMVPLDGGRFATADLNDLYRRVINRNNRLKQLLELNAPEVIVRNERRMLQEAVDALLDNSARHGKAVQAATGQKRSLKSLADQLKGKQGRFRQNLLGKRIDYSGRSVIVVGPNLLLHQCGLPKQMALELFKPFIISKLIQREIVHNVRSASRYIESGKEEVWDILEEVVEEAHVLLNRAPTLHRLGIQAFKPILIEGKAIRIHPLVCTAFNADFDGDQMAVHVPLTKEARHEAATIMLSSKNLLKPATGEPIMCPEKDMVWGAYYLTMMPQDSLEIPNEKIKNFAGPAEAKIAYQMKIIKVQEPILIPATGAFSGLGEGVARTTVGRILFNEIIPEPLSYYNDTIRRKELKKIVGLTLDLCGDEITVKFLDELKALTFHYLTQSGLSWGIGDLPAIPQKEKIIEETDEKVKEAQEQYEMGLLTNEERYAKVLELWSAVKEKVTHFSRNSLSPSNPVYSMIESGARGSWDVFTQVVGMRGLMTSPSGDIIELPVKGSFREGIAVLEYFISTHGARKGLADTALRTASAGYLTRRLVDVAQDMVIIQDDCGSVEGISFTKEESDRIGKNVAERVVGRFLAEDIVETDTEKVLAKSGSLITPKLVREVLKDRSIGKITVRSVLTCKTLRGTCQHCYGYDLGRNELVKLGTAVGIIAAQSIGEPGTQLTMRTFHTGGTMGQDITKGLPRVDELFEVRSPKRRAVITEVSGRVEVMTKERVVKDEKGNTIAFTDRGQKIVRIHTEETETIEIKVPQGAAVGIKDGTLVTEGMTLFTRKNGKIEKAQKTGLATVSKGKILLQGDAARIEEIQVPPGYTLLVRDGDRIEKGYALTDGHFDLHQLFRLRGKVDAQKYLIQEIQYVYSSEGSALNDKHIEVIIRQLFSKVYITDPGDTVLNAGEVTDQMILAQAIENLPKDGTQPTYDELLVGITKISLYTDSFLSAASFQQTTRVLVGAAISGKIDHLRGLKENVIIGRLIPAGTGFAGSKKESGE